LTTMILVSHPTRLLSQPAGSKTSCYRACPLAGRQTLGNSPCS
jgi:hypothetical protein